MEHRLCEEIRYRIFCLHAGDPSFLPDPIDMGPFDKFGEAF